MSADTKTHRNLGRQSKLVPKTRHQIRWEDANYDYLIRRAQEEGLSIAALVNRIVRRERQS